MHTSQLVSDWFTHFSLRLIGAHTSEKYDSYYLLKFGIAISVRNATDYMLVHLQGEHGTAVTAKTGNLAKSSRPLELVRDYVT